MHTSMQTVELEIRGLDPGPASRGVCSALYCIHGVAQVRMAPNERHVTVIYNAYMASPNQFKTAVRVMGCEVERLMVLTADMPARGDFKDSAGAVGQIHRSELRPL